MASLVPMTPTLAHIVKRVGIAVIVLAFSSTVRWPHPRRLALAHALTIGMAAGPVARANACRSVLPSMDTLAPPEASLKAFGHALKHRVHSSNSSRHKTHRHASCPG